MIYSLPFAPGENVIELGGGDTPMIRPNMDFRPGPTVDIVGDLSEDLPFEDEQFDGVFCSYAIEHVSWRKVRSFIAEVYRILKWNGKAVFVTANLKEQARRLVETEEWTDNEVCMIFGDQNYLPGNMHLTGFSEQFAVKLFKEAGFTQVIVLPHPNTITDMIIEVSKSRELEDPNSWDNTNANGSLKRMYGFGNDYFNGGRTLGGYKEPYRDFPINYNIYNYIMALKPESVLELGCARGYILKRIEDSNPQKPVKTTGLDVSRHCYLTRVSNNISTWDITHTPWPIADKSVDLAYSISVLEHIPEQYIPAVVKELERTCKRSIHAVNPDPTDDKTRVTIRDLKWWNNALGENNRVIHKSEMEAGALSIPGPDGYLKLNIGCFTVMYHHGWFNIDQHNLVDFANQNYYQFVQHDILNGIPFGDQDVHVIYASHFLEHLNHKEGLRFLKECHRVLRKGGVVRIAVPDTKILLSKYMTGTLSDFDEISVDNSKTENDSFKFWNLLTSGHKIAYDQDSLADLFMQAGFKEIFKYKFRASSTELISTQTLDMFPEHSLYIEAIKD